MRCRIDLEMVEIEVDYNWPLSVRQLVLILIVGIVSSFIIVPLKKLHQLQFVRNSIVCIVELFFTAHSKGQ